MKKLVVGNWKLHLNVPESTVLIEKLKKGFKSIKKTEVVVCPSFVDIYPASKELQKSNISLGAQNTFYETQGAYTGEVSPYSLAHFVKYAIVGHSERRLHFGETDKIVARKAEAAYANGIIPIICVGETLHEKEDGLSKLVVMSQVETGVSHLTSEEIAKSVIAYEPVWAISTNQSIECKPDYAEKMAKNIRALIKALYGENTGRSVRIIYGGNINDKNVTGFAKSKELDGVLVGAASLDYNKFNEIVEVYEKHGAERVIKQPKVVKRK